MVSLGKGDTVLRCPKGYLQTVTHRQGRYSLGLTPHESQAFKFPNSTACYETRQRFPTALKGFRSLPVPPPKSATPAPNMGEIVADQMGQLERSLALAIDVIEQQYRDAVLTADRLKWQLNKLGREV